MRVAWGITGAGDMIAEVVDAMAHLQNDSGMRIDVFVSKAGRQVLNWYRLWDRLNTVFPKVKVEVDANVPFIAGPLQIGKYDALVVAPLSANSAAKIAHGIGDTLLTNAVAQTLKGATPVLLLPVDQRPGVTETVAPDGSRVSIKTRSIDLENVDRLRRMEGVRVAVSVAEIADALKGLAH